MLNSLHGRKIGPNTLLSSVSWCLTAAEIEGLKKYNHVPFLLAIYFVQVAMISDKN